MPLLEEELSYYNQSRSELLSKYEGKFVLIKDSELIGSFENAEAAYEAGLQQFGNTPFLIKQVLREEQVHQIPALSLGILHASL